MKRFALLAAMLATGFCGMVAEYSVSTTVSYLIGNSVAAYSIIISTFMLAMGLGAYFSQQTQRDELSLFLGIEFVLSIFAACSTVFITQASRLDLTWEAALSISTVIGLLIGFEIPLLMRINEKRQIILKENVALVFGADYVGSFIAGILYSTFLVPYIGVVNAPILSGFINFTVACLLIASFWEVLPRARWLPSGAFVLTVLVGLYMYGERVVFDAEQSQYEDKIVFNHQSKYQKIVITQADLNDYCLYLNGQTQFCSVDEERYHEMLVHPAFALNPNASRILVLGGGDGLAIREILKYPQTTVHLVDLDPDVVKVATTHPILSRFNDGVFKSTRVTVEHDDAFSWLRRNTDEWDVILLDLPDPSRVELAKLYSLEFYRAAKKRLADRGVLVTQSTSPIHAREAFVSIHDTIKAAHLSVVPYRTNIPTFGDWGWNIAVKPTWLSVKAMKQALDSFEPEVPTKFLNQSAMQASTRFEKGVFDDKTRVSRLARPTVLQEYEKAWNRFD